MEVVRDTTIEEQEVPVVDEVKKVEDMTPEQIRAEIAKRSAQYKSMNATLKPEAEHEELLSRIYKAQFEQEYYKLKKVEILLTMKEMQKPAEEAPIPESKPETDEQ